jgi:MFS family permease
VNTEIGMRRRSFSPGGLWRHADFRRLWAAESVSLIGSQITMLALPLLAVSRLDASAAEMGLLAAAGTAPFFFCSLPGGVFIDRRRRRPVLIAADVARAALLLTVPLLAWLGTLHMTHLYAVAFAVGVFTVLFEIGHYAYVPAIVGRTQIIEANSKLQVSHSASDSAGPGLAGLLVQVASAPFAILLDAATFLVSALFLRRIETIEPAVERRESQSVVRDVREGLGALLGHRLLRPIVLFSVHYGICFQAITAIYILYAVRELDISPLMIGVIFAAGGLGAIPGALLSAPVARRFGVGPTIVGGLTLCGVPLFLIPLASGSLAVPLLASAKLLGGIAGTIVNVQQWSLRQIVTPDHLQGRVTASHRFLVYGSEPLGALLGGWLGTTFSLRLAITILALGVLTSPIWGLVSPLRDLRNPPAGD